MSRITGTVLSFSTRQRIGTNIVRTTVQLPQCKTSPSILIS